MNFTKLIKTNYQNLCTTLIKTYTPPKGQVTIKFIPLIAYLPFAGFIYLYFYMAEFGIAYESLYFNINDCIAILYEKGMLFYLTVVFLAVILLPIIIDFTKNKEEWKKFKNWQVFAVSITPLLILPIIPPYLFKTIPNQGIWWLSLILAFAIWVYLFISRIGSMILILFFLTLFCIIYSATDAIKRKKDKPKFNIILKDEGKPIKILSETDSCSYFILKTSDYIFIMDTCKNKVRSYPISDLKSINFTPK